MADVASDTKTRLEELADLALDVLPRMYDERTGLFSHKTVIEGGEYVNRRPSPFYSSTSLIGILQQRRRSPDDVVPVGRALDALHTATAESEYAAILGNLAWLCALAGDQRGVALVPRLVESVDPSRNPAYDVGQGLYGLVEAAEAFPQERDRCMRAAAACTELILARFAPSADLFRGPPRTPRPSRSWFWQGVAGFAGQVYALHGLARYYRATGERPPDALKRAADQIVAKQGPLGQWWWLYYAGTGSVLEGYPVYSVHQDGMAFLALCPLEELGLGSYGEALALGLDWLYGRNELSVSLVEKDPQFIPRNIQRVGGDADGHFGLSRAGNLRVLARSLRQRRGSTGLDASPEQLEVLRECRSYHLGWVLCAHALTSR